MATNFSSYYDIPSPFPEFDWTKTAQRSGWYDSSDNNRYKSGTVLQKKAHSVKGFDKYKAYKSIPFNDAEALKRYVLNTGAITEETAEEAGIDLDDLDSLHGVIGVFLSGNTNSKYSMATNTIVHPNLRKLQGVHKYIDKLDKVVETFQDKGLSDANIKDILNSKSFTSIDQVTAFAESVNALPDDIPSLFDPGSADALANSGIQNNDLWSEISTAINDPEGESKGNLGGTTDEATGTTTGGVSISTTPTKSATGQLSEQIRNQVIGDPDIEGSLTKVYEIDGETYYTKPGDDTVYKGDPFDETDDEVAEDIQIDEAETPPTFYNADQEVLTWNPDLDGGVFTDTQGNQVREGGAINDAADYEVEEKEAIADLEASQEEFEGLRGEYDDYLTSITGGNVTAGVAKELGYTDNGDGTFTDNSNPNKPVNYTLNEKTGFLEETGLDGKPTGVTATTPGSFETEDFAGQINTELTNFLSGYTDDDGNEVKGFLDFQEDLVGAAETYKTDMQGLQGLYDEAYAGYEGELRPLRDAMGGVTKDAMEVARDANSPDYYNRLSQLYYDQAKDEINRSGRGAREDLNAMYANAGMDPSSPAFTAAMTDLSQSRADALVSARRQSILDSYGLGSDMLRNRTSALGTASSAIANEMGALDSLYGVKMEGLNTRRDMIGQIYKADENIANTGISGLNTVLNTKTKGIELDQDQYFTGMDLKTKAFDTKFKNLGTSINITDSLRGLYDTEGKSAFDTAIEYDTAGKSDAFTLEALMQSASQNPEYEVPQWIIDMYGGGR